MSNQLPKHGGGQLLPFKGSIDPCHPPAERMPAQGKTAPAVCLQHHQTRYLQKPGRDPSGIAKVSWSNPRLPAQVTGRGLREVEPVRSGQVAQSRPTIRPKHHAEIANKRATNAGQRNSMLNNPKFANRSSFIEQLRQGADAVRAASQADPWESSLRKIKGRVGQDGVERISTTDMFDELEVPMRRRPALTIRLSRVMRKLGWRNIRARGLNPGSYRDRVRGFAREVSGHPATARLPNEF